MEMPGLVEKEGNGGLLERWQECRQSYWAGIAVVIADLTVDVLI